MKYLLLAIGVLLLAWPAGAGDWYKSCRSTMTTTGLSPGQWACYQPSSTSDDSATLSVARCENFDVLHHLDVNADATASSTTVQIRSCPNSTASTNSCWILENLTLNGNPATDTEAIYGGKALYIYADLQADGVINDPQLTVFCNGPQN